jgi:outer membrane cobalamin receptor
MDRARWMLGYSFVKATYESEFDVTNAQGTTLSVRKGDQIPGIPNHQLKLRGEFDILSNWQLGATALAFSDKYMHGNENNAQADGKIAGYAILNLDSRYQFSKTGWQAFAKVNNVFDTEYSTGGMLGQNWFTNAGAFASGESDARFVAPGAPRAGWVGLRYELPGTKSGGADSN